MTETLIQPVFKAAPIVDFQVIVAPEKPSAPQSYQFAEIDGAWIAYAPDFHLVHLKDVRGRLLALIVGIPYELGRGEFLTGGDFVLSDPVESTDDLERSVLPLLAGSFVLLTSGELGSRLYPDHAGSIPMVYAPDLRQAASTVAMLLSEAEYHDRFQSELHQALVVREGAGGWIPGTLTAHRNVFRLLPNHYLDLSKWTSVRFWPKAGEFDGWREIERAASSAAREIHRFSRAACRSYTVGVTLTAGFDTRLVLASCKDDLDRCRFFTIDAPLAKMDLAISQEIARRFSLKHEILDLVSATPAQMAAWDRMAGDCMIEAPRLTHPTLRKLDDRDALLTGLFGEIGRCRYYRQDLSIINQSKIDAKFIVDRLTVPPHPELIDNVDEWLSGLSGQPNSVVLDLSLLELKLGCWAMPQRSMTSSVKWAFMPFTQRPVFDAFIGVAPHDKDTKTLFWKIIKNLWPELSEFPINKYGDARDYGVLWSKLTNVVRVRRFLRDRLAKKGGVSA